MDEATNSSKTHREPPTPHVSRAVPRVESQVARDIVVKSREFGEKSRDWTGNRENGAMVKWCNGEIKKIFFRKKIIINE